MHWAFFGAQNPSRTPTTKDFGEEGGSVEKGQPPRLSAPDRPEQSGGIVDVLPLNKRNQISDDGARLIRVVRRVGDDRRAVRVRQLQSMAQLFWFGCIEGLTRNVAVSGRVLFRVEIAQPHVHPKVRQTAAEGAVTAARIERNSWQIKP